MKSIIGIAVDHMRNQIYWTDLIKESIYRAPIHGNEDDTELVMDDLGQVESLTVDWIGRKLYWANSKRKCLDVIELDGSYSANVTHLASDSRPRAIDCDPNEG